MKKIIFHILAFLFCLSIQAQQRFFGVIQDADGYVNVRSTSGAVIGKLLIMCLLIGMHKRVIKNGIA